MPPATGLLWLLLLESASSVWCVRVPSAAMLSQHYPPAHLRATRPLVMAKRAGAKKSKSAKSKHSGAKSAARPFDLKASMERAMRRYLALRPQDPTKERFTLPYTLTPTPCPLPPAPCPYP